MIKEETDILKTVIGPWQNRVVMGRFRVFSRFRAFRSVKVFGFCGGFFLKLVSVFGFSLFKPRFRFCFRFVTLSRCNRVIDTFTYSLFIMRSKMYINVSSSVG